MPTVAVVFTPPTHWSPDLGLQGHRLEAVAKALANKSLGVEVVPWVARDPAGISTARERILAADAALVWVDPGPNGSGRAELDPVLAEAALAGVWVSARPEVIAAIGTKEVLVRSAPLGWSADAHLVTDRAQLWGEVLSRLDRDCTRVLKPLRGNRGQGVWRIGPVEAPEGIAVLGAQTLVRVQHAKSRDLSYEVLPLAVAFERLGQVLDPDCGGALVDQAYVAGIASGMIRCYLVGAQLVGFARQSPPPSSEDNGGQVPGGAVPGGRAPRGAVFGLPSPKAMVEVDEPSLGPLRKRLESQWVPGLCALCGLTSADLPALWDIDLMVEEHGGGEPSYVLCEINASCVTPFPPVAPQRMAELVSRALADRPQ